MESNYYTAPASARQFETIKKYLGLELTENNVTKIEASKIIKESIRKMKVSKNHEIKKLSVDLNTLKYRVGPSIDNQRRFDVTDEKEMKMIPALLAFEEYMMKNITIFLEEDIKETGTVELSTAKEKKQYRFFGTGCSISYFKYNYNSTYASIFAAYYSMYHKVYCKKVMELFDAEYLKYMETSGFPFEAMWSQDYSLNQKYKSLCCQFARETTLFPRTFNFSYYINLD